MLFLVSSLLPLLSVAYSLAVPSNLPSFCRDLDCPRFTVLENTTDYELRHYEATKWVAIEMTAATYDVVHTNMFMTLFHYIDGGNVDNVKIPMTAPVVGKLTHGQGPNCASNFTMHFMLPHDQWVAPIQPSNPMVKIVSYPPMDVYVKSFSGWARDELNTQKAMELYLALTSDSTKAINVETKFYFTAGYDGPYHFADRHNEVWVQKL